MPLEAPILDDRTFDDILVEAQERIVRYSRGEWTDFNDSDPGMTLVQLFAWLTESMLYRMNQVPERNYIKFLELLNLTLKPAEPATAALTFTPKSTPDVAWESVPRRTQVQAENASGGDPLTFETTQGLSIIRRPLNAIQVFDGASFRVIADDLADAGVSSVSEFHPFGWAPQTGSALFLGFLGPGDGEDLSAAGRIFPDDMRFRVSLPVKAGARLQRLIDFGNANPGRPRRSVWEYKRNQEERQWRRLDVLEDETEDLTRDGYITIQGPREIEATRQGKLTADDQLHFWLRCRLENVEFPGGVAPLIEAILPNTVAAENLTSIRNEFLGTSEGVPDQHFQLQQLPVVVRDTINTAELDPDFRERHPGLVVAKTPIIEVTNPSGQFEVWERRADFLSSGPDNAHFTLDAETGMITFGDGEFGRIPIAGSEIVAMHYLSGGGAAGNVVSNTIVTPRSTLPFVENVSNFRKAEGGSDAQKVDELRRTAPGMLRAQSRAVTTDDFEQMAVDVGGVKQARALPLFHPDFPNVQVPGAVTVVVIADTVAVPPRPTPELLDVVGQRLDRVRLITTELFVVEPEYLALEITATIEAEPTASFDRLKQDVKLALQAEFNPFSEAASQWRDRQRGSCQSRSQREVPNLLGRDLFPSRLFDIILDIPGGIVSVPKLKFEVNGQQQSFEKQVVVKGYQLLIVEPDDLHITVRPAQDR